MWKSRRKLLIENIALRVRVGHLENLICPTNQHDFVKIGFDLEGGTGRGDETVIYHYQCRKCDKTTSTYKLL
jgi:hypothetical protein